MRAVEEARNGLQHRHGVVDAADGRDGADEHHGEREEHEQTLDEVGHDHGQIAADDGVGEHDGRADHHGQVVVPAEQGGEELADRHEAAADVHAEEHEDDQRRDGGDDVLLVVEALGEEVRHGDRVTGHHRIAAQSLGDDLPIEVGADRQSERGPQRIRGTGEVGETGQSHEQPSAHVGSLGAERGQPRSDATPAREVLSRGRVGTFGVHEADRQHGREIDDHGHKNPDVFGNHVPFPLSSNTDRISADYRWRKTLVRPNVTVRYGIEPQSSHAQSRNMGIIHIRQPRKYPRT